MPSIVDRTPHQTLGDAVDPHGRDVQHGADGRQPEVCVDQADAVHLRAAEDFRDHVVDGAEGDLPPQLGASRISDIAMPNDCAQSTRCSASGVGRPRCTG